LNIEEALSASPKLLSRAIAPQKMLPLLVLYKSAIKDIRARLEIIDNEFQMLYSHNPIHHIESRLKSPRSLMQKLERKGRPVSIESIMNHITDMAGIRVICYYIDEVYAIADMLSRQDDIRVWESDDYIKNPKPSGYRSLHLTVSVPVFLTNRTEMVPVEIQIRTIAMDFWASLEHQLAYKTNAITHRDRGTDLHLELKNCAEAISSIDVKMQDIYHRIHTGATGQAAQDMNRIISR
jgi:putative GTP pyrophosphokinase